MVQDIIVIVFCIIAFGAALWGWWIDSGKGKKGNKINEENQSDNRITDNAVSINEKTNS